MTYSSKKAPLIYVWLGNMLPKWAFESFAFSRKNNPDREIFLLHNNHLNNNFQKQFDRLNIKIFFIKFNQEDSIIFNSPFHINSDFWKLTSFRFEIIRHFIRNNNIRKFFQAEIDNLLFNFDEIDNKLDKQGKGLFVARDSINRAIPSFFYCNNKAIFDQLIDMFLPPFNATKDFYALGMLAKETNNLFNLPTESYKQNSKYWQIISPEYTEGIFDAAAIGQYCLGIDSRINKFKPTYNLFINENATADFDNLKITSNRDQLFLKAGQHEKKYKIINLHVHSKDIKKAISLINKGRIYYSLQKKKKILMAGRYKIIYLLPIFLKNIIKNLIKNFIIKKF